MKLKDVFSKIRSCPQVSITALSYCNGEYESFMTICHKVDFESAKKDAENYVDCEVVVIDIYTDLIQIDIKIEE